MSGNLRPRGRIPVGECGVHTVAIERTLSIIKPTAVKKNVIGQILAAFEENKLRLVWAELRTLSADEVRKLYEDHQDEYFFEPLIEYMISGPVLLSVLEGENAVSINRRLIGMTDPSRGNPESLRARFGDDVLHNGLHGSANIRRADIEVGMFCS